MTSVVITPHEPEHADEYKEYIADALSMDEDAWNIDMPARIRIMDVGLLLTTLRDIEEVLRGHPDTQRGETKVHYCYHMAKAALTQTESKQNENTDHE